MEKINEQRGHVRRGRLFILALIICLFFPLVTFSETIVLKSGKTVEGKLIEKTDKYIKIDFQGVPLTYYLDEIESVSGEKLSEFALPQKTISDNSEKAFIDRAVDYTKIKSYGEAVAEFTKAIEINPNSQIAYTGRGYANSQKGSFDQAVLDLTKAIEINPQAWEEHILRGDCYSRLRKAELSISDYTKAIEINPNVNFIVYVKRGTLYSIKGDYLQAVVDLSKAIEINPSYCLAYNMRADTYTRMKEYNKAWQDINKLKELGCTVVPEVMGELKKASGR